MFVTGAELDAYVEKLGWTTTGDVVAVPPNPDNHIEATVVQESIKLPRKCTSTSPSSQHLLTSTLELTKVIAHGAAKP